MGFFYSIYFKNRKGEDSEVQFKNAGEFDPSSFEIGDKITTSDGIHFDHDSCFVVFDGKIVAAFEGADNPLFTKWGHMIPFPDLSECNPLQAAIKKLNSST